MSTNKSPEQNNYCGFILSMMILLLLLISIAIAATDVGSPADTLRRGSQKFSAKFYNKMVQNTKPDENFVISPFPVQILLAAVASAASDPNEETVKQIRTALELPEDMNTAFKEILPDLEKGVDDFKLFNAFKLYFAQDYTVKNEYRDTLKKVYRADIETVSFNREDTLEKINSWVRKNTNERVKEFLKKEDITSNTKNLLIEALYLRGKWMEAFYRDDNVFKTFHGIHRSVVTEMMINTRTYDYGEDIRAQYLKLNFLRDGGGAYMIFVLPRKDIAQIESNLQDVFAFNDFNEKKVACTLPKFNISSDVKLKNVLQKLGVNKLFEWGIKLKGLQYSYHPYVKVSDAFQKATLEVNEWGVTASSVQDVTIMVDDVLEDQEPKIFTADRPFIFQIVVNGLVVFAGRVVEIE